MPSVGSSNINSFEFITNALSIANCCYPPDKSPPLRSNISFKTEKSSYIYSGTVVCIFLTTGNPIFKFSLTVSSGNILHPCGT